MNKVATYLNGHLAGEILVNDLLLNAAQFDGSVLVRRPEMVARPADTNDIRKIMRFCSQLAEKGHVLPVVVRGRGTDSNGAATGGGISLDTQTYLRHIKGIDPRQQLVHVQAGIQHSTVNEVLAAHKGLSLPSVSTTEQDGTIGGAIAAGADVASIGSPRLFSESIQQLEVILANGDVLQTGRLSKRDLAKKKGLSTLEGDIYRQIDNLIDDNAAIITALKRREKSTAGFWGITQVKHEDGSFDLTPLFFGSQGALGIISEVIMKAEYVSGDVTVVTAAFADISEAQAAVDEALQYKVSRVDVIDGRIFARAAAEGKQVGWAPSESFTGAVVVAVVSDFSERTRGRSAKKLMQALETSRPLAVELHELESIDAAAFYTPLAFSAHSSEAYAVCPPVFSGLWLPTGQLHGFLKQLRQLETDFKVQLPVYIDALHGFVDVLPIFNLHKITERRTLLKLIPEIARAVADSRGGFAGRFGDGRLKAGLMQPTIPPEEGAIYAQIKQIFDPANILMPHVKQEVAIKELADELNVWCRARS